jgi:hypothetical protein
MARRAGFARATCELSSDVVDEPISDVVRAQQELYPKEDLSAYRGEWVLLRKGWLVAHDRDVMKLAARPERREGDALAFVPLHPTHFLVV